MSALAIWALGGAVVAVAAALLWVVSVPIRNASIVDPFWGPAYLLISLVWFLALPGTPSARALLVLLCVGAWALRLGLHLSIRAVGKPEDPRYAAMREKNGVGWWWRSLFWVFLLQAALVWVIASPLFVAIRSTDGLGGWDLLGFVLFGTGLAFEAIGDAQLSAFRDDPSNRGRVLDTGLWRYTRHPNYFGDALLWWGFGLFGVAAGEAWTLFGPALMTFLLLKVSGVVMLEDGMEERRPGYAEYVRRTSAFVPWFPDSRP